MKRSVRFSEPDQDQNQRSETLNQEESIHIDDDEREALQRQQRRRYRDKQRQSLLHDKATKEQQSYYIKKTIQKLYEVFGKPFTSTEEAEQAENASVAATTPRSTGTSGSVASTPFHRSSSTPFHPDRDLLDPFSDALPSSTPHGAQSSIPGFQDDVASNSNLNISSKSRISPRVKNGKHNVQQYPPNNNNNQGSVPGGYALHSRSDSMGNSSFDDNTRELSVDVDLVESGTEYIRYLKMLEILRQASILTAEMGNPHQLLLNQNYIPPEFNPPLLMSKSRKLFRKVATAKYRGILSNREAMYVCCRDGLFPYLLEKLKVTAKVVENLMKWETDDADVSAFFSYYYIPLRRIFFHFGKKITALSEVRTPRSGEFDYIQPKESPRDLSYRESPRLSARLRMASPRMSSHLVSMNKSQIRQQVITNNTMNLDALIDMLRTFKLLPQFEKEKDIKHIFRKIKNQPRTHSFRDNLSIEQFLECLARVAVHSFTAPDRPPIQPNEYFTSSREHSLESTPKNKAKNLTPLSIPKIQIDQALASTPRNRTPDSARPPSSTRNATRESKGPLSVVSSANMSVAMSGGERKDETRNKIDACRRFIRYIDSTYQRLFGNSLEHDTEQNIESARSLTSSQETPRFKNEKSVKLRNEILKIAKQYDSLHHIYLSYTSKNSQGKLELDFHSWRQFCSDFDLLSHLHVDQHSTESLLRKIFSKCSISGFSSRYSSEERTLESFDEFIASLYYMSIFMHSNPERLMKFQHLLQEVTNSDKLERFKQIINSRKVRRKIEIDADTRKDPSEKYLSRNTLRFDVFRGPIMIAIVEGRPGVVKDVNNNIIEQSRFVHLEIVSKNMTRDLMNLVNCSENFHQLLRRFIQHDYDIAGSIKHSDHSLRTSHRQPIGRCWRLYEQGRLYGNIMDYSGQFTCFDWQPEYPELFKETFSVTLYVLKQDDKFYNVLELFQRSKEDLEFFRDLIHQEGKFSLIPVMPND